jgi:hypothetical protein
MVLTRPTVVAKISQHRKITKSTDHSPHPPRLSGRSGGCSCARTPRRFDAFHSWATTLTFWTSLGCGQAGLGHRMRPLVAAQVSDAAAWETDGLVAPTAVPHDAQNLSVSRSPFPQLVQYLAIDVPPVYMPLVSVCLAHALHRLASHRNKKLRPNNRPDVETAWQFDLS